MTLNASTGNIGASGANNAVVILNGASGSVTLAATAPGTVSGNGNIFLLSTTTGDVIFDNSTSAPVEIAGTSFNLTASGNIIQTAAPQTGAVRAPSISLISTGGNIGADPTLLTPNNNGIDIDNGVSGNISLFASAPSSAPFTGAVLIFSIQGGNVTLANTV